MNTNHLQTVSLLSRVLTLVHCSDGKSCVIVSDDDGRSFHDGGCVPDFIGGSEAQVAELRDGSILLASRLYGDQKHNPPNGCRHFSLSSDQGEPHDTSWP